MQQHCTIEQSIVGAQRQPDGERQGQFAGRGQQRLQCLERSVQQGVLLEEVIVGIGGQAELREQREYGLLAGGAAGEINSLPDVQGRGGDLDPRRGHSHAGEPVPED